jgi:hypothetical protein
VATQFDTRLRLDEGRAAVWGGMVSGALVGLKADLLSGGLTLGGGLLAGGLIGAFGAAGLARCVNLVRGTDRSYVAWNPEALEPLLDAALLRYLAVAHFGRGRGQWVQGESPPHWAGVVLDALAPHRDALALLWREREPGGPDPAASAAAIATGLQQIVATATADALVALYPQAAGVWAAAPLLRENAQPAPQPSQ